MTHLKVPKLVFFAAPNMGFEDGGRRVGDGRV
jgi:hypothetical protein